MNNDPPSQDDTTRDARALVLCGCFVLYGGLALAVFSSDPITVFLGVALAVTGALNVIPQLVAQIVSRPKT